MASDRRKEVSPLRISLDEIVGIDQARRDSSAKRTVLVRTESYRPTGKIGDDPLVIEFLPIRAAYMKDVANFVEALVAAVDSRNPDLETSLRLVDELTDEVRRDPGPMAKGRLNSSVAEVEAAPVESTTDPIERLEARVVELVNEVVDLRAEVRDLREAFGELIDRLPDLLLGVPAEPQRAQLSRRP
ncbi:hypothetical protein [Mumia flava]|uniref:hypothetical protein n=1 Tax=Mumia flava TaxID=1348852 RepID=UPI0012FDAD53|nr:hypothetical protein [Mumia flava]